MNVLSSIEIALEENQIGFTTHYGKVDNKIRTQHLSNFRVDPFCRVLLATLKTAGVGIDLRCAQKVYIMVSEENTMNKSCDEERLRSN